MCSPRGPQTPLSVDLIQFSLSGPEHSATKPGLGIIRRLHQWGGALDPTPPKAKESKSRINQFKLLFNQ